LANREYRSQSAFHRFRNEFHGPFGFASGATGGTNELTLNSRRALFAMKSEIT
jgi:hypothetical protein